MEIILNTVQPKVTEAVNGSLFAPYTYEEVCEAVKFMHLMKAPGLDGMPTLFLQKILECGK